MALSLTTEPRPASWKAAVTGFYLAHPAIGAGAALFITTFGWSLMWAQALGIVEIVPQWLCIVGFFAGIVLIPYCVNRSRLTAGPR